jgi:flagellar hook-associated protein 1 FlgK
MTSSFMGLTNALQALNTQRYGLDVTGQNISNANTAGYVRQRAELAEVGPVPGVPSLYATQGAATGVTVAATNRLNDPVLDARVRAEQGRSSYTQTAAANLNGAESLFVEPSDTGMAEQLNDLWKSFTAVANKPDDLPSRTVVLQKANAVASSLNATSAALTRLTQNTALQLSQATTDINGAAGALAQLNGAIAVATATGAQTNSLADQRDTVLLKLSNLTGGQATAQPDGTMTFTVGSQTLVSGVTASSFAVNGANQLTVAGATLTTAGGTAQALADALNTVLPKYSAKLDGVASALASTVNAAHQAGFDLSGASGGPLFTGSTAATISVVITDPTKLAASATASATGNLDAGTAKALSAFGTVAGGADSTYRQLIGSLASDVQSATQQAIIQDAVTTSVNNQQQSMSGVSMDEETSNLLTFQRAYQASSRVLTTVDEMLDTLINRTGKAGL